MDRLLLLKNKLILRHLELNQIGYDKIFFKFYDKLLTIIRICFLDFLVKKIFKKKKKLLTVVSNNLNKNKIKKYNIDLIDSSKILNYANNYVKNNFFVNSDFEFINEKLIDEFYTGLGFKCPLIHDFSTNKNLRLLWDKARSHHLLTLYIAYIITKNKKYYKITIDQINVLLVKENYLKNYLWGDALNLSVRSLNILSLFQVVDKRDNILRNKLIELYIINCEAIVLTRSKFSSIINNHHFCETLALIVYYVLIGNKKKLNIEVINFKNCYRAIFYKNGCNYEGSLLYQRFLLEFLLVTQYFHLNYSKKNQFINILQNTTEEIWNYSSNIVGETQEFKQFGDLDYGQVIKLNVDNYFSLNEINNLYNFTKLKSPLKPSILDLYNKSSLSQVSNINKKFLVTPGYSRVKLDKNIEIWIDTDYPGFGKKGIGGHGHNDVTSIILNYCNEELICDYGVSSYFITKKGRDYERSSFNHNVVNRVDFEQSQLLDRYHINPNINTIKLIDKSFGKLTYLELIYKINYKDGVILNCKRRISYKNKILKISDIIFSKDDLILEQNWNFNKEKLIFLEKKDIYFKKCKISFSNIISDKNIHHQYLSHYKIAKKQLRIKIPLVRYKLNNGFKYTAELKLNAK